MSGRRRPRGEVLSPRGEQAALVGVAVLVALMLVFLRLHPKAEASAAALRPAMEAAR